MRIPWKARVSQLRQRAILTLRYYLRLPIDDIRDDARVARDREIDTRDEQLLAALETQASIINRLEARLHWYETHVPAIKRHHKTFLAYWKKVVQAERERQEAFTDLVTGGVPEAEARSRIWPARSDG